MDRRAFLAACSVVGLPVGLAAVAPKPIVRMSVDCDLSVVSFLEATALVGAVDYPARYVLTVHTDEREYSERILRHLFQEPYRWQDRVTLQMYDFADLYEWTLEGRSAILHSMGA